MIFCLGRGSADERDRFLHPMKRGEDEREADVVVALLELADQLALRRIVKDRGRCVEILGDVSERELHVVGAWGEESLRAGDLTVEQLVSDTRPIAVSFAERTTDAREQDPWHQYSSIDRVHQSDRASQRSLGVTGDWIAFGTGHACARSRSRVR